MTSDAVPTGTVHPVGRTTAAELFDAQFRSMVRPAALLGSDDPEDTAQEAFTRLPPAAARDAPSAEATVLRRELASDVVRAVLELPPRQRQVVVLRYWLDLSEAQIADAMGTAPGTVKSQAARALAALSAILETEQS